MKNKKVAISIMSLISLSAVAGSLSGCESRTATGNLDIKAPTGSLSLKDKSGKFIAVRTGLASIEVNWKLGFGTKLIIKSGGTEVSMDVPKESFTSETDFYIRGDKTGQDFDIHVERSVKKTGTHEESRMVDCTTSGLCTKTIYDFSSGNYHSIQGFYLDCPGNQNALFQVDTYQEGYHASFLPLESNQFASPLAEFNGDGQITSSSQLIRYTSECRIPFANPFSGGPLFR